jgi:hypothetical protein
VLSGTPREPGPSRCPPHLGVAPDLGQIEQVGATGPTGLDLFPFNQMPHPTWGDLEHLGRSADVEGVVYHAQNCTGVGTFSW